MNKLLLHAFYMLILLFTTVSIASGETVSGSGWSLTDGVLTIQSNDGWADKENYTTHRSDVTSIVIVEGVTSVPNDAFYMGNVNTSFSMNITKITIPSTVTSIGDNAFIKLWHNGTTAGIEIEGGENVKSVGKQAFLSSKINSLASFTSLKTIGEKAFYGTYQNATGPSIQIPASVESIGEAAFQGSAYQEITFQAGSQLKTIGAYAFKQLPKATTITIPKSVTSMEWYVFQESKLLETIQFEKGINLSEISSMMFSDCDALRTIEIPASVTTIYDATFSFCERLENITFEADSKLEALKSKYGHPSFKGCTALKSITFPSSLKNIYYKAFDESSLENVTFTSKQAPEQAGNYGKVKLFSNATSIQKIIVPEDATGYDQDFWQGSGVQDKIFEEGALRLGDKNISLKYDNGWKYKEEGQSDYTDFSGTISGKGSSITVTIEEGSSSPATKLMFDNAEIGTLTTNISVEVGNKRESTISQTSGNGALLADKGTNIPNIFAVVFTASTDQGTIRLLVNEKPITSESKVSKGPLLTIEVTPASGYRLKGLPIVNKGDVDVTHSSNSNYTFTMPDKAVSITAEFESVYQVEIGELQNGKITADQQSAGMNDKITLTITPSPGYRMKASSLSVQTSDGTPVNTTAENDNITFTMPSENVTVTAEFELLPLTLKESNPYTIKYKQESSQWIYTENTGGETPFSGIIKGETTGTVTVESLPEDNQLTFEDATISTLSIGNDVTAFIKGKATISDLSGDGILHTSDKNITIEKGALALNIKEVNGCTTTVSVNKQELTSGMLRVPAKTKLSIATTAAENCSVKSIKVNNNDATAEDNNTYNYEVQGTESNLSIVVTLNYLITLKSSEHGKITALINESEPSSPLMATEGDKVTLSFKPEANYDFTGWIVVYSENQPVQVSPDNTFTMPASPVTVEAQIQYNPPYIPPTPTPTYHIVIVPEVEGVSTDPVAGSYEVENGGSFHFHLTLDKEYSQSSPIVTTDRSETITPRSSDGAYIIKYVRQPIAISIDGIIKNPDPVANETIDANSPKVWTKDSYLHLQTPQPETVFIYTFNGTLLKKLTNLSGNKTLWLPQGNYIVLIGKERFKVQVK